MLGCYLERTAGAGAGFIKEGHDGLAPERGDLFHWVREDFFHRLSGPHYQLDFGHAEIFHVQYVVMLPDAMLVRGERIRMSRINHFILAPCWLPGLRPCCQSR